jgi:hypothetical protein
VASRRRGRSRSCACGLDQEQFASTRINPTGEFPEPLPIPQAAVAIGQFDGYTNTSADQADMERQWPSSRASS